MSRVVETRIRLNIDAQGGEQATATIGGTQQAADKAQQAFRSAEAASNDLYASIVDGSPEAQRQLSDLAAGVGKLRAELTALPEGLRSAVEGIVGSLQRGDVLAATHLRAALPTDTPAPVVQQLDTLQQQTTQVMAAAPVPVVQEALGQPRAAAEKPLPLLKSALESLREGDLEEARRYGVRAARGAIAAADQPAFELASSLPAALRQAQEQDNGIGSRRRYDTTLERLESALAALEATSESDDPLPVPAPTLGGRSALGRAARTLSSVDAALEGGVRRAGEFSDLEARLGRAGAYLGQAERGGAPDRQIEELREQLEALTKTLEETRASYDEAARRPADPAQPPGQPPATPNPVGDIAEQLLNRLPSGGLLGRALPGAAVVTGGVQLANLADRWLVGQNREARDEQLAQTDLARQLGIYQDPWTLWRDRATGFSRPELLESGYNATDAGRVAARLDLPAGARDTRDTVMDVLRLSRSSGLDEQQITGAVRQLGLGGGFTPGDTQQPLETIKLALTEAVKNGVSQADTLNALVGISQEALMQGRELTPAELAYQAALQATLRDLGTKTLQGAAGVANQQGLNAALTGQGDPTMQMVLAPAMEGVTAADLGLDPGSAAARALTDLEAESPYAAAVEKLKLAVDGGNPEVMARLAEQFTEATGGRMDLMLRILEKYGVDQEAALTIAGNGLQKTIDDAAGRTDEFAAGRNLDSGPQSGNRTARESAEITATREDLPVARSYGNLALNNAADLETTRGQRRATETLNRGKTALGTGDDEGTLPDLESLSPSERTLQLLNSTPEEQADLEQEYERQTGQPLPQSWLDRQVERFNDLTAPSRWLPGARPAEPPLPDASPPQAAHPARPVPPPAPAPQSPTRRTTEDGLAMLGATAMTNAPGETYSGLTGDAARLNGSQHRGVDLRIGQQGQPDDITSPWDQVEIIDAGANDSYGNWMSLQAGDGTRWQMGHLQDSMKDSIGRRVRRGGYLATEGNSGASSGYHLDLRALEETPELEALNRDPEAFWRRFDSSLNGGKEASEVRVTVVHEGLENVQVRGLEPGLARQFEQRLSAATQVLSGVTTPKSHAGGR